jgi:bd-type cytochrome oxidase subunit I
MPRLERSYPGVPSKTSGNRWQPTPTSGACRRASACLGRRRSVRNRAAVLVAIPGPRHRKPCEQCPTAVSIAISGAAARSKMTAIAPVPPRSVSHHLPGRDLGTVVFLIVCYAMYMRTDEDVWLRMFRFWRRTFAVRFTLGVVSRIVLTLEFGLNRSSASSAASRTSGGAFAAEFVIARAARPVPLRRSDSSRKRAPVDITARDARAGSRVRQRVPRTPARSRDTARNSEPQQEERSLGAFRLREDGASVRPA